MQTMKAEQLGTRKWRVLAIPFGGPLAGGKDLDGEFFSPRTDIKAAWFKERPVIFDHGMDDALADEELGIQGELTKAEDGWWAEMQLNRSHRYWSMVDGLLRAGKMYGSSGALSHLVRKDRKTGEILVWPHIEQTLTPTPANPYARITTAKALSGFDSAGIAVDPAMRAILADLDTLAPDLPADLPSLDDGGDAAATKRLVSTLDTLEDLLTLIRTP
jgi:hypothetical protein